MTCIGEADDLMMELAVSVQAGDGHIEILEELIITPIERADESFSILQLLKNFILNNI